MGPAAVRRPITVTVMLLASITILLASPVLLAVAAVVSAVTGRPALIFARLGIDYFALELGCLIACAWLWMASVCGLLIRTRLFQHLHYRLLRWFVHAFTQRWLTLLDIHVTEELPSDAIRALEGDQQLLFFSRHAGPGRHDRAHRPAAHPVRPPAAHRVQAERGPGSVHRSDRSSPAARDSRHGGQAGV